MGGQAQSQQPVFYDSEMGQYYTQSPTNNSPFAGVFGNLSPLNLTNGSKESIYANALFGKGGERTYLNNFGMNRQQVQQAPYQYADVSLESLFPQLASNSSQLGATGLLGGTAPSATGQASSGAGRFM